MRFSSTQASYEDRAHFRSLTNRNTITIASVTTVSSMLCTVTARYTTRSSKFAIEKTAKTCDSNANHCHRIVYTIYFFAWDNSPTSLVFIIFVFL